MIYFRVIFICLFPCLITVAFANVAAPERASLDEAHAVKNNESMASANMSALMVSPRMNSSFVIPNVLRYDSGSSMCQGC